MLTGCQTNSPSPTTVSAAGTSPVAFCDAAEPFYWSASDTRPTQKQAVAHNAVGKDLCKW
jgi:hypothetical protein